MAANTPYHDGELFVQQLANESEMARINSGALADAIPAGALRFIKQQPMVVVGSVDSKGQVWASLLFGPPGFLQAQDPQTLMLDLSQPRCAHDDPLWANVAQNPCVGLLMIELATRRRLRVNGRASNLSDKRWIIEVETAYPNCPKYIQRRRWQATAAAPKTDDAPSLRGSSLTGEQMALISSADTFFVASAHPERGVDASHRGGHRGFVHQINDHQLRIPDFAGNSMFNTLGNFVSYPYAGLVFIDFERARLLQLSGRTEILWVLDDPQQETGGTRRYWQFDVVAWREAALPFQLEWEFMDASPHIPALKKAEPDSVAMSDVLLLRVGQVRQESERVKSFHLHALDGALLPVFEAGAHLRLKVTLSNGSLADRHYSLLSDPSDRTRYQIGVLLEPQGRGGSRYLHRQIREGDIVECRPPKNDFPMVRNAKHTILIAGGIGITPMLAMMHQLVSQGDSFELHYSARTNNGLAFRERIERVAGSRAFFYVSEEADGERLDLTTLLATPQTGVHVYTCGPRGLINAVREAAAVQGWSSSQIHFESFGVQSLPGDQEIQVYLARSNKKFTVPAEQTVLDTLLNAGINVPHDCKRGECSMCVTRVLSGDPDHRDLCLNPDEKATSMCLCVSRAYGESLEFDL